MTPPEPRWSAGPLFDTPLTRVLDSLPIPTARLLRRFLGETPLDAAQMQEQVSAYLKRLDALAQEREFIDLAQARRLGAQCEGLLKRAGCEAPDETRRLVHAAVRYFVEDADAEGGTASPIGFDDDALVLEHVARELNWADVLELGLREAD